MDPPILLSPSGPRFPPRGHSRSPSRSPTRSRITDDILSDLSPATTLDAFTNASGALRASIEAATPTQRAFGIRAAITSKKIEEWVGELARWPWPAENGSSSAGFDIPAAKRQKTSDKGGREGRTANGNRAAYHKYNGAVEKEEEEEYWGSISAREVELYEERIEEIEADMEDLDVEEIKSRVLDTHVLSRSRPTSPNPGVAPAPPFVGSYTRMDDFTAVVTATVLQALPNLSRLMSLMDVWSVRLLILRQTQPLLLSLNDAEMALKSGWNTLDQVPAPKPGSDDLSRDNYEIMRDVLQGKVTVLGQKIDHMLDTLEGRQDTIPEAWLDRMEAIEQDYGEWVVSGDRKLREGEWARDAARRRSQKLMVIPEDEVAQDHPLEQETEPKETGTIIPDERLVEVTNSVVKDDDRSSLSMEQAPIPTAPEAKRSDLPAKVPESLQSHTLPIATLSSFDGAQDPEPASIALNTPTLEGTPLGHGSIPEPAGYFSAADVVASQLPPHDLVKEVNKPGTLQRHAFALLGHRTTESTTPVPSHTEPLSQTKTSALNSEHQSPAPVVSTTSTTTPVVKSSSNRAASPISHDQSGRAHTPTKVPRFGHGFANLLRASSINSHRQSESSSPLTSPGEIKKSNEERSRSPGHGLVAPPKTTPEAKLSKQTPGPFTPTAGRAPEKIHSPAALPAAIDQLPTVTPGQDSKPKAMTPALATKTIPDEESRLTGFPAMDHLKQAESEARDFAVTTSNNASLPISIPQSANQRPEMSHSRQISATSTISGYSMSDPSPEICEAATEYFSPVVSPGKGGGDWPVGVTPTLTSFSGAPLSPRYADEERPETPRARQHPTGASFMVNSAGPVENWVMDRETPNFVEGSKPSANSTKETLPRRAAQNDLLGPETLPEPPPASDRQVPVLERQNTADLFARSHTPDIPIEPQAPFTDEKAALSYADFEESPSLGRVRIYSEGNDYSPPSSPPPIPPMSNRRSLHVQVDAYDAESLSSESPLTPSESSFLSNLSVSPAQNMPAPSKVSDDQLQQQISEILESIPARIRLTSEPDTSTHSQSELRPFKQRPSLSSSFRPQSRAATPSFTLAPAYALNKSRRPTRAQIGTPEIKLYHLSRSTGEAPIKLFVRLVGEHGERVMVRVGGGWADLGEYLREYAAHHGRRSGADKGAPGKDKVEIQDLPSRTVSSSSVGTVRNGNGNGRSSPISFSRPASSLERPLSSLNVGKTRRSVGEEESSNSYSLPYNPRSPSTPLPLRSASRQGTPAYETPPARSSSRLSWTEEDSSLGLAGPKGRKVEISAENAAWVESMKEKVRLASAEKDRDRERKEREARERRVSGGTGEQFGEMGKVGGTKRLFKKGLGGSGGSGGGG